MQSDYGPRNIAYAYDSMGNLLSKSGDSTAAYAFDAFGRMTSSEANGITSAYTYDGNGLRLSKQVNGVTTQFINDGEYVIGEISGSNTVKYTYGTDIISIDNNGVLGYYHTDERGSVTGISNANKELAADYDYDAFGNESGGVTDYYNPIQYCGEYYDLCSGLIYLRNRYYDPSIGRFISEDLVQDGLNWYVYCNNNPVNFIDPTGYAKEGDERFSQSVRDEISIYGQMWTDADTAYSLGIISIYEKSSVQSYAE